MTFYFVSNTVISILDLKLVDIAKMAQINK